MGAGTDDTVPSPRGGGPRGGGRSGGWHPGPVLAVLAVATAIGTTGMSAASAVIPLLAARLMATDAVAGLPVALVVVGSAGAALLISRLTARLGRARGLVLGYAVGAVGGALVVGAVVAQSFAWLLVGSLLLGAANSSILLARYAAAALVGEAARGRALGAVFFATAVGAAVSTGLLGATAAGAIRVGLPPLGGACAVAVVAFVVAAAVLGGLSWGRTPSVSGGAGPLGPDRGAHSSGRDLLRALGTPNARLALVVLTVTNLVMVAIMVIAPVRMMAHGDGLDVIGLVISIHVIGMFGPSPFSGWLADRVGPEAVAACGGVLVGAAGVAGGFVDMRSPSAMMAVLAVLGVGWNFGIVGGSTLLAGSVPGPVRPRVEGIGEVATSLAAAVGAPAAGLVAALAGFAALSLTAAAMSVAVLAVLAQQSRRPARRLPERAAAVAAGPEH